MGANYDVLLSPCTERSDVQQEVVRFLSVQGHEVASAKMLDATEIDDDNAVIMGPPTHGWTQTLANCSSLRISLLSWFASNPLGIFLSTSLETCVHLWSLDSGYVVGYALYSQGHKKEGECVFAKTATDNKELLHGVSTPPRKKGDALGALIGEKYEFEADMSCYKNLELGMAALVARFGCDVHLIDFHGALDDKEGIAIEDGKYNAIHLSGWSVVTFAGE